VLEPVKETVMEDYRLDEIDRPEHTIDSGS
jgi:hypothetical protein